MMFSISYSTIEELLREYYREVCENENLEFTFKVEEVHYFDGDEDMEMKVYLLKRRNLNIKMTNRDISFPFQTLEIVSCSEVKEIVKNLLNKGLEAEGLKVSHLDLHRNYVYVGLDKKEEKKLVLKNNN